MYLTIYLHCKTLRNHNPSHGKAELQRRLTENKKLWSQPKSSRCRERRRKAHARIAVQKQLASGRPAQDKSRNKESERDKADDQQQKKKQQQQAEQWTPTTTTTTTTTVEISELCVFCVLYFTLCVSVGVCRWVRQSARERRSPRKTKGVWRARRLEIWKRGKCVCGWWERKEELSSGNENEFY